MSTVPAEVFRLPRLDQHQVSMVAPVSQLMLVLVMVVLAPERVQLLA